MTEGGWQARLTQVVAAEIRRYRMLRKLSAKRLADRCQELGMIIPQAVLANLENGRRESISVAELVILAQALGVPPALLIAPVTTSDKMEILPGQEASTTDVLDWLAGVTGFVPTRKGLAAEPTYWTEEDPAGYVHLYRHHGDLVDVLIPWRGEDENETRRLVVDADDDRKSAAEELRLVRRAMREDGLRVPDLPPELAYVDAADEAG